jgi:hypothetical protein
MKTIKLGDATYELRFTTRAICRLEQVSGRALSKGWFLNFGTEKAAQLIWAGIVWSAPKLSVDEVIDLLPASKSELNKLLDPVLEAWLDSQKFEGETKETEEKKTVTKKSKRK